MVQLSGTKRSSIAILWVSLVIFANITLFIVSQRVFVVVSVYFVIDSVRELFDTPSCVPYYLLCWNTQFYHLYHRCLPLDVILSQFNEVHILSTYYSLRYILILSSSLRLCLPNGLIYSLLSCLKENTELWAELIKPTQPPIQWVPGVLSLGVKRSAREADHSPPSCAEVKNASSWSGSQLKIKHRDNFTFTHKTWCEFWGFHGSEDSSRGLLGCDAVWCCGRIPTYQRSMLPPSSGWTYPLMAQGSVLHLLYC
jgi:hypothetical protein